MRGAQMPRASGKWVAIVAIGYSCCVRQISAFRGAVCGERGAFVRSLHAQAQLHNQAAQGHSVCVIGGGFAGLACAYELASLPSVSRLCLIDTHAIGDGGASAASAGIMNPFTPKGKLAWNGLQAFEEAERLLGIAEAAAGRSLTYSRGILRPFGDEEQGDRAFASMKDRAHGDHLDWLSLEEYRSFVPHASERAVGCGRYKYGRVIDAQSYLKYLWKAVKQLQHCKAEHMQQRVKSEDMAQLAKDYSIVVAATGPHTDQLLPEMKLHFKLEGSYNVVYHNKYKLQHPLLAGQYIVPFGKDLEFLVCGSTKEYDANIERLLYTKPDPVLAAAKLKDVLEPIYPPIVEENWKPIGGNFGVRALTARSGDGRLPIIRRHETLNNVWALGGLGSRGLLYHAHFAKKLVAEAMSNNVVG